MTAAELKDLPEVIVEPFVDILNHASVLGLGWPEALKFAAMPMYTKPGSASGLAEDHKPITIFSITCSAHVSLI